jgi:hypothetical protein
MGKKHTIQDMQALAKQKGGFCLSKTYTDCETKLKWQCKKYHQWLARPSNIRQGSWCLECGNSKKNTIFKMQELAISKGGKCVSEKYVGAHYKLKWECSKGHQWEAVPKSIRNGSWCPKCLGRGLDIKDMQFLASEMGGVCLSNIYESAQKLLEWKCGKGHKWKALPRVVRKGGWCKTCKSIKHSNTKKTIIDMQILAEKQGGKCLSSVYVNAHTKLEWECRKGHIWKATPHNIRAGKWCGTCFGNNKTIIDMQQLASNQGGRCLSNKYINARKNLEWECANGHRWEATPTNIQRGTWCLACLGGTKKDMNFVNKIALDMGGRCLSDAYSNKDTNLKWKCSEGHVWEATLRNIQKGKWCPYCAGMYKTIQDMQELAAQKDGRCLSNKYLGNDKHLEWECADGHKWDAVPGGIIAGSWCPHCQYYLSERLCKAYFEDLFQKPFKKNRPTWLINSRENRMELDGYCEELSLAFEYHGQQHFKEVPFFHNSTGFQQRVEDDKRKRDLCVENDVKLIEVPYTVPPEKMSEFIVAKAQELGIYVRADWKVSRLDPKVAYSPKRLEEMRKIAFDRGGKCLSDFFVNANTHLEWECGEGHKWKAKPVEIRQGRWCRRCSKKKKKKLH